MRVFAIKALIIYAAAVNLAGFVIMGIDKKRAIRGAWRISEASLFMTAFLGGACGCTLGMHFFRHKTRHWYFRYGLPALAALEIAGMVWLLS